MFLIGSVMFNVLLCNLYNEIESAAKPLLHAKIWPPMENFDIWDTPSRLTSDEINVEKERISVTNLPKESGFGIETARHSKVLNFFPVPVDDECLSQDGRRSGICLNVYECRIQGGSAGGECALGFGVCCVFVASCDDEIKNNITYFVSPNFPSFMDGNLTECKLKVNMITPDISQLRIDFQHFSLGQPNRATGACEGDTFLLTGGLGGNLTLCGQNSGQHVYYDVGGDMGKKSRQGAVGNSGNIPNATSSTVTSTSQPLSSDGGNIEILMNFTSRLFSTRLWEIRVTQIPFSQRAPAGCLQYFTGMQGAIQTFNFADNGRHLANQNYRACVRQETGMCSITYEPCHEQAFRIGPNNPNTSANDISGASVPTGVSGSQADLANNQLSDASEPISASVMAPTVSEPPTAETVSDVSVSPSTDLLQAADDPDAVEGSGGGDAPFASVTTATSATTTSPIVRGGFDIISFFRDAILDLRRRRRRSGRQFQTICTDRITMPCIVEDFIGTGMTALPDCEPVHCGSKFCSSGSAQCRIESTVTPFRLGIHFGDGNGKGSPEDNIGACLKFNQMPCL